jgi:hypothetical protein
MTLAGKNRVMIYGPKSDGICVIEFSTAKGEVLAILERFPAELNRGFPIVCE